MTGAKASGSGRGQQRTKKLAGVAKAVELQEIRKFIP